MKYNVVGKDMEYCFDIIRKEAKLCEQSCEFALVTDKADFVMEHIPHIFSFLHWLDEEDPLCQKGYVALEKYAEVSLTELDGKVIVNLVVLIEEGE